MRLQRSEQAGRQTARSADAARHTRTQRRPAVVVRAEADRLDVEERMRRVTESLEEAQRIAHLGSWEWEIDTGALDWSDEVFRLFGFAPQQFLPTYEGFLACVHPGDRDLVAGSVESAVYNRTPYNIQFRALKAGGGERCMHAQGAVLLSDDRPTRMVGTVLDVTEQQRMLDALAASERFSRSVLDSMSAHTAVLDRDGTVVATNRAWRRFAVEQGCEESFGLGSSYLAVADASDHRARGARESAAGIRAVLSGVRERFTIDYPCAVDGEDRWYTLTVQALAADAGGAVVSHEDVTDRTRAEVALAYQGLHDALTRLPNRVLLADRLGQAIERQASRGGGVAVLFFDLDRFAVVNDSLGHTAGDELLMAVAERLRSSLRPGDTVARFGGDEFVVVCEGVEGSEQTEQIVTRVSGTLTAPFVVGGSDIYVTASVGVAIASSTEIDAEAVLRNAGTAVRRAKELGRNCYAIFDDALRARSVVRLELDRDLRAALAGGGLRVEYQPIFDVEELRIVGAEALLRWDHPSRGAVPPVEFIPMAEETGLIVPVGAFALRTACEQVARWDAASLTGRDFEISVNLSARQLGDPALVALVQTTLADTGISPARLCLEITETALMQDVDAAVTILASLKRLGVRIALDDFGTGNASLNYLSRFSVDVLKVDRTFVAGLGHDCGDYAIVASVVSMAASLGLSVVAEGVETELQLEELERLECGNAQGFLLARPMRPDDMGHLLEDPLPTRNPRPSRL